MKDLKHSSYTVKATGSMALKSKLMQGDIKAMAFHFKKPYMTMYHILSGKQSGDKNIVECAERIVAFYEKVEISKNVSNIIKSYKDVSEK